MNILIVHAIVILLSSYAAIAAENDNSKKRKPAGVTDMRYNELLEMWFPKDRAYSPKGLLLNTVEEAVLFPDWIKLRMIRSNNTRLLAAASDELDVEQLVLFVQSFGIPTQSMSYGLTLKLLCVFSFSNIFGCKLQVFVVLLG